MQSEDTMTKHEQEQPVFDFSRVSRVWSNQLLVTMTRATRAQILLTQPPPTETEDLRQFMEEQMSALADIQQIADEQASLIAEVLVEVPRGWLLPDAPETLDWSVADNLNYLQMERYNEIMEMIRNGEAQKKAKN